eukprot:gene6458-9336_t
MRYRDELWYVLRETWATVRRRTSYHVRTHISATKRAISNGPSSVFNFLTGSTSYYRSHPKTLWNELVSGFTVAILQIPESVAFSFVAGVDPVVGLRGTVFMAIVCGALGARPPMISGIAGAMAVVVAEGSGAGGRWREFERSVIERMVFMTLILTGIFQFVIGALGFARLSKIIPFTAMIGYMNGLAIIILISQFDTFKECPEGHFSVCARQDSLKWMSASNGNTWMVALEVVLAAVIVYFFPLLKRVERFVPAPLVALVLVTAFEHGINRPLIGYPARLIKETASVSGKFAIPDIPSLPNDAPWGDIITYALVMALVGMIESIMTSDAVAEVLREPNGNFTSTHETLAQGMGNFVSGLFGGLGGDAMMGQSLVNVINGGRYRLSAFSSGIFLAIVILALPQAIGLVPVACLGGILFTIVVKTFYWHTFILLFKLSLADSLNIVLVTVLAVMTNLAIAVGAGVVWRSLAHTLASSSLLHVHWELLGWAPEEDNYSVLSDSVSVHSAPLPRIESKASMQIETASANARLVPQKKVYYINGPLFFGSVTTFRTAFTPAADPHHITIDLTESLVSDFSGVAAIYAVYKRYQKLKKAVFIRGLDAHSRMHIHRSMKLKYLTMTDAETEAAKQAEREHIVHVDDDEESLSMHALEHLMLFRPQGDELHHPDLELSAEEAIDILRSAGVVLVEAGENSTLALERVQSSQAIVSIV